MLTTPSGQPFPPADPLELLIGRERIGNPIQIFEIIEAGIPITNAAQALTMLNVIKNQEIL